MKQRYDAIFFDMDGTLFDLIDCAVNAGIDFCLYRPKGGNGVDLPPGVGLVTALSQLAALLT